MLNKRKITVLLKNSIGVNTSRKLIAFYVDDWGSVRTRDKKAVAYLKSKGVDIDKNRFSQYDSLASEIDLCDLFDTLRSVKDKNGNSACFTAVMNPCNPNFEAIRKNRFSAFVSESFTETLKKYGYHHVFDLWKQGMNENIFYPMFHGTEHVSRSQLIKALQMGNKPDVWAFECESVGVPGSLNGVMQPYYIERAKDNEALAENVRSGLNEFEKIFGFRARQFRAGGDNISPELYPILKAFGIEYMDETTYINRYLGDGKYKRCFAYTGKINKIGQKLIVRNCVFEPANTRTFDPVMNCIGMMDIAFRCHKPAIISSHRVDYAGSINENNRKQGLLKLSQLLHEIVKRYPDVEFVNADQLADIIYQKQ